VAALAAQLASGAAPRLGRLVLGPGNAVDSSAAEGLAQALAARFRATPPAAAAARSALAEGGTSPEPAGSSGLDLDLSGCELDAPAAAALARIPGLAALSLFGACLSGEAVDALVSALAARDGSSREGDSGGRGGGSGGGPPFAALRDLNLSGCRLALAPMLRLLKALEAGPEDGPLRLVEVSRPRFNCGRFSCPCANYPWPLLHAHVQTRTKSISHPQQVGANPGADEAEFAEAAAELRQRRARLDVHWRAADGSSEGAERASSAFPPAS
jgi:hypothetical protein